MPKDYKESAKIVLLDNLFGYVEFYMYLCKFIRVC